jgi:signal transduction histidine kinase
VPRATDLIRVDGEPIPVECDVLVIRGSAGTACGWIVLVRDLRPVRELEREVEKSRTLAALGELAAGIVHEVRNPLGGIEGFGSLLLRSLDPADHRHRLASKLLEGVQDLKHIVDDLIILARPSALHLRPVSLAEVITRSMDLALHGWREATGRVDVAIDAGPRAMVVLADPRTLTQALVNLLRNAAEAMPDGGTITVLVADGAAPGDGDTGFTPDRVTISIRDTGPGIEPGLREKVFAPFFTTKEKGTGLGLFIARSIIRAHGGEIELESSEGTGTHIRLTLDHVSPSLVAA